MSGRRLVAVFAVLAMQSVFGSLVVAESNKGKGDVVLSFRGLVALDVSEAGKLKALFLSPRDHEHRPVFTVDASDLPEEMAQWPSVPPDLVAPAPEGHGTAVWTFQVVELIASNVEGSLVTGDETEVSGKLTGDTKKRIRWLPTMLDIHDRKPKKIKSGAKAAANGKFTAGAMEPFFDDEERHGAQLFNIGTRKCTAVADGIRLNLKVKELSNPILDFKRLDKAGRVVASWKVTLRNKAQANLTNYPLHQAGGHLEHFKYYFDLVDGGTDAKVDDKCDTEVGVHGATAFPMRCAPVKFP